MKDDHDIPINVIILSSIEDETEIMIDACLDIWDTCKSRIERKALIQMIVQDTRELTLREILTKDIQNKAHILEQTKKYGMNAP